MYVTYDYVGYNGKVRKETYSLEDFLCNEVLRKQDYSGDSVRVILEEQPKEVCKAMGRLINVLITKGVFTLEDLKNVADCDSRKADSLAFDKE